MAPINDTTARFYHVAFNATNAVFLLSATLSTDGGNGSGADSPVCPPPRFSVWRLTRSCAIRHNHAHYPFPFHCLPGLRLQRRLPVSDRLLRLCPGVLSGHGVNQRSATPLVFPVRCSFCYFRAPGRDTFFFFSPAEGNQRAAWPSRKAATCVARSLRSQVSQKACPSPGSVAWQGSGHKKGGGVTARQRKLKHKTEWDGIDPLLRRQKGRGGKSYQARVRNGGRQTCAVCVGNQHVAVAVHHQRRVPNRAARD